MTALQQFWYSRAAVGPVVTASAAGKTVTVSSAADGAVAWLWNFGDGTTSTLREPPPYTYAGPGPYTVTLTTTYETDGGCSQYQVTTRHVIEDGEHICVEGPLWSLVTPPGGVPIWYDLAFNNGAFLVLGSTLGPGDNQVSLSRSLDGLTWTTTTAPPWPAPPTAFAGRLLAGNGRFVMSAGNVPGHPTLVSTDGITWLPGGVPPIARVPQFAGGLFFLFDFTSTGTYCTSTDAATFSSAAPLFSGRPTPTTVSFANGAYYATSTSDIFRSPTGLPGSWVRTTIPASSISPPVPTPWRVYSFPGRLLCTAFGSANADLTHWLESTDDGFTWVSIARRTNHEIHNMFAAQGVHLAFGAAFGTDAVSTTVDGLTFTRSSRSFPSVQDAATIEYNGDGVYVASVRRPGVNRQSVYRGVCG